MSIHDIHLAKLCFRQVFYFAVFWGCLLTHEKCRHTSLRWSKCHRWYFRHLLFCIEERADTYQYDVRSINKALLPQVTSRPLIGGDGDGICALVYLGRRYWLRKLMPIHPFGGRDKHLMERLSGVNQLVRTYIDDKSHCKSKTTLMKILLVMKIQG